MRRSILAVTLPFVVAALPASAAVRLRTATLDATAALTPSALALAAAEPDLYAVAARGNIDGELRRGLEASDAEIVAYLPDQAFALWATPQALTAALARDDIAYAVAIPPTLRVLPELASVPVDRAIVVEILGVPAVDPATLASDVAATGLEVIGQGSGPRFQRVTARVPAGRDDLIAAASRVRGVFSIGARPPIRFLNDTSIWVGQSGLDGGGATPIFDAGIHGEGQVVGIIDSGLDVDMCFFGDPAGLPPANVMGGTAVDPTRRKVIAYDFLWSGDDPANPLAWDNHGHGTHVAGSVAGDDSRNPLAHDNGDGMAPAAKLVFQDGGFTTGDDCSDMVGLGCPVVDLTPFFDQAYAQGARIHTNSWGDQENTHPQNDYTAACVDADEFMWTHPDFLLLFAAGNDGARGDDSVGSPSTAKNVIAVGSTRRGSGADGKSGFSSLGWAADGRIKPTVMCPGSNINSANNDGDIRTGNCGTVSFSGTSMASPTCAGLGALARQYFTDGYYPAGKPIPANAFTPSAALVKAALINSARNMGGEPDPISRQQGFGRVTLEDTLHFRDSERDLIVVDEVATFPTGGGAPFTLDVDVVSATVPLKVTLVWTDPPSNPMAAVNLINDLDLTVTGPSGAFKGNVLANGVSVPAGTYDRLNVEEQVLIVAPQPGSYRIEVAANAIPQGPQGFALVLTGDFPPPAGVRAASAALTSDAAGPCTDNDGFPDNGELARITVTVENPGGTPADLVTVAASSRESWFIGVSPSPVALGTIAPGGTAVATFDFAVDAAPCRSTATLDITTTSAANPWSDDSTLTVALVEDRAPTAVKSLDFEGGLTDLNGDAWTSGGGFVVSGTRQSGGARSAWAGVAPGPGHCDGSGSNDGANMCATLTSPVFTASATSTLSLSTWYEMEAFGSGQYWDRGNVHVIEGSTHTLLVPTSGRAYDGSAGDTTTLCHVSAEDAWAGTGGGSWARSTFSLAPWAGRAIRVEINYNSDPGEICEGLYVDDIAITDLTLHTCDAQRCGSCATTLTGPLTDLRAVKTGGSSAAFTWVDSGTGSSEYHLNSVSRKELVTDTDPMSPRQTPRGQGTVECTATVTPACSDPDALDPLKPLLFYQALPACGPGAYDEGPVE